jgi:dienelactone hydrolase
MKWRIGRWRMWILLVLGALLGVPFAIAVRSFVNEYYGFRTPPTPVVRDEALRRLPALVDVSWESDGATIRGWFLPGRERAAVVLVHGSGGNRVDVLAEMTILAKSGFSLLAFDWPGQGDSGGLVTWGEPERASLRRALDWLATRPEVDPARMGAFGFSLGGTVLVQVAATDMRVRAVAVAGTPGNLMEHARWENRKYGFPALWGMVLADRARGMNLDDQVPEEVVTRLAPRPLFVALADRDLIVPPALTRDIYTAAGEPKELMVIEGASHGEYALKGGDRYARALEDFFVRSLR